jgi:glucose-6-phosphate dehydrogenase assembly protein OpcA
MFYVYKYIEAILNALIQRLLRLLLSLSLLANNHGAAIERSTTGCLRL